jgi:hypothetical protein
MMIDLEASVDLGCYGSRLLVPHTLFLTDAHRRTHTNTKEEAQEGKSELDSLRFLSITHYDTQRNIK